jgi:hypothetical protein
MRRLLITVFVVVLLAPAAAFAAGGQFSDDDTSVFEADIEWLAGAGITGGCNPPANDNYCPGKSVTRGQMAAFMRRFAGYLGAEDGIVSEADHAAAADTATTAQGAANADLLGGLSAEDLIDSSPTIINAADFTQDGFGAYGDHTFGWASTGLVYDGVGSSCVQAPVAVPHGATLASADVIVLDVNGFGSYGYFNAELGDPASLTVASMSATASATSQTVTLDLTGMTASDTKQNWIGVCLGAAGDTLYGARVHYTITDASVASEPKGIQTGDPITTSADNR